MKKAYRTENFMYASLSTFCKNSQRMCVNCGYSIYFWNAIFSFLSHYLDNDCSNYSFGKLIETIWRLLLYCVFLPASCSCQIIIVMIMLIDIIRVFRKWEKIPFSIIVAIYSYNHDTLSSNFLWWIALIKMRWDIGKIF